ncbi:MAG: hypothetical protein DRP71_12270 [Verrucomicrobia bacterium]|nr:MAG: hypothetical protein DRP71_12270 [Verrucomicrobiota bacterium]
MTMETSSVSRSLTEAISHWADPACLVDGEGRVMIASRGLAKLADRELEELKGLDPELLLQSADDTTTAVWQTELLDQDGSRMDLMVVEPDRDHLAASGRTVQPPGIDLDRLNAIGEIVPPLFHDLNNMLGSISGLSELAAMKLPDDDPMKDRLGKVVDTVTRASALGRQISLLARTPVESPSRVEMIDLIEEAMVLARSYLNRGVVIETRWPDSRLATDLHPSSLRHLVVEIILAAGIVLQDREGAVEWAIAHGDREGSGQPTAVLTVTATLADPTFESSDPFPIGFFRRIATISSLANSFGGAMSPVRLYQPAGFSLAITLPVKENKAL